MAKNAKNKVIAGEFKGWRVRLGVFGQVKMSRLFAKSIKLNKDTVKSYEVVTDENRKSLGLAVGRGLVGSFLLGPLGLVAGAVTGKSKSINNVIIIFNDETQSLLEIDGAILNAVVKKCF